MRGGVKENPECPWKILFSGTASFWTCRTSVCKVLIFQGEAHIKAQGMRPVTGIVGSVWKNKLGQVLLQAEESIQENPFHFSRGKGSAHWEKCVGSSVLFILYYFTGCG